MSAQELREAAALMRSRATHPDISGSRWEASPHGDVHDDGCLWVCDSQNGETAEHIASWHPAVALAVADWLDREAERHDSLRDIGARGLRTDGQVPNAFTVARAYLGGDQ